jgi:hypothetical protein
LPWLPDEVIVAIAVMSMAMITADSAGYVRYLSKRDATMRSLREGRRKSTAAMIVGFRRTVDAPVTALGGRWHSNSRSSSVVARNFRPARAAWRALLLISGAAP